MSYTTVLGVTPNQRPVELAEFQNSHGWAPNIWRRLVRHRGIADSWRVEDAVLNALWRSIEELPDWQQAPLVLTFDTGVIPSEEATWAADQLAEFEQRLPEDAQYVNHVPAMADLLRSTDTDAPLIGVWATSVTDNPFDPWDEEADDYGSGIPLAEMYVLERHREQVLQAAPR